VNFFLGSQISFNFIFSQNIKSQTEKSQNSLTPALHHGYCTFTVHHCENGGVFSLTSGKLMNDLRPELQPTLNQEQERSVLFVTRQSIFRARATNVQCFWTNFFRGVFGQAQCHLNWLCCIVLCIVFCCFCCFVGSSCVVL